MSTPIKTRVLAALLLGSALFASPAAQAVPVSAWELDAVSGFRSDAWSFNDLFTVGASSITVSSLGALDVGLNGFIGNRGILVGLYRESDQALLASTAVLSTDPLSGNYRFSDIPDVQLQANTAYRVVAANNDDLYNTMTGTPSVVDPRITWDGYGYCAGSTPTLCDEFSGTERTWLGNFQLDNGGAGKVPEPSSLALIGLGLLALVSGRHTGQA
jgi:PEP-CTERM motif